MAFQDVVSAHRRITLLRVLAEAPGHQANDSLLQMVVEQCGITSTRDQIRTELAWLRDQGLVTLKELSAIYIAQITQGGVDVAAGRTTVPGVKRPSPRADDGA